MKKLQLKFLNSLKNSTKRHLIQNLIRKVCSLPCKRKCCVKILCRPFFDAFHLAVPVVFVLNSFATTIINQFMRFYWGMFGDEVTMKIFFDCPSMNDVKKYQTYECSYSTRQKVCKEFRLLIKRKIFQLSVVKCCVTSEQ